MIIKLPWAMDISWTASSMILEFNTELSYIYDQK